MRPTQLNQHTVKSDRNKDTHAHYTNLKQHSDHTRHTRFRRHQGLSKRHCMSAAWPGSETCCLRTPTGCETHKHRPRSKDQRQRPWVSRMETSLHSFRINVQSTHHLKHLVHTHPLETLPPFDDRAGHMAGADGWRPSQGGRDSLERRWSSRTFRYGYLVTTSS